MRFSRILLKLSGEMLAGHGGRGLDSQALAFVAGEIHQAVQQGVQVAVVVGAGNHVRGAGPNATPLRIRRQPLDTMGMLATAINATALADTLSAHSLRVAHRTTLSNLPFARSFDSDEADALLNQDHVLVFSGGTGLPFFSTDTAAAVRALQIGAQALVKGTQVDGVYDRDPRKPGERPAVHLARLTHQEVMERRLQILDASAIALCAQHKLPILVYNAHDAGNLLKLLTGNLLSSIIETE